MVAVTPPTVAQNVVNRPDLDVDRKNENPVRRMFGGHRMPFRERSVVNPAASSYAQQPRRTESQKTTYTDTNRTTSSSTATESDSSTSNSRESYKEKDFLPKFIAQWERDKTVIQDPPQPTPIRATTLEIDPKKTMGDTHILKPSEVIEDDRIIVVPMDDDL
eukprot:PhF_6_TR19682/c0_g1_i2/m.28735